MSISFKQVATGAIAGILAIAVWEMVLKPALMKSSEEGTTDAE